MKKILMTAAIAFAGFAAQAQLAQTVTQNPVFVINCNDQFTMTENIPTPLGYTIGTGEYDLANLPMGSAVYSVQSNLPFHVTTSLTSITWADNGSFHSVYDNNTGMLSNVIRFRSRFTGGNWYPTIPTTPAYPANPSNDAPGTVGDWVTYSAFATPVLAVYDAPWGNGLEFTMDWDCTPGWNYAGGNYTGVMVVTGTQE